MLRTAAVLLTLAACVAGQTVPIAVHDVLAIATVRLNGQGPFRMLIDTGASSSSLLPEVAAALHLRAEYRVIDVTPAGERMIPGTRSVRVEIGSRTEDGVEFVWQESSELEAAGLHLDGVLGQSFMSRFDYLLDYKSKRLAMEGEGERGIEATGKRIPFESAAGRMMLPAMSPDEGSIRLVLDSGASHVLLWRTLAPGASSAFTDLIAMNGRRAASLMRIPLLVVAGHAFQGLNAVVLPRSKIQQKEDGLLPAALFRSVYVSNSQGYVKLVR